MPPTDGSPSTEFDWKRLRARLQSATAALSASPSRADSEQVLVERARVLARETAEQSDRTALLEIMTFSLSGERYAVEARYVQEVLHGAEVTPVPNTPEMLRGIHNLRGEVLAVMDLRSLLHVPPQNEFDTRNEWLIVLGEERIEFAMVADAVEDVTGLRLEVLLKPTVNSADSGSLIAGVTAEALTLLDGDSLLRDPRLQIDCSPTR